MIFTVLEGVVEQERWQSLENAYKEVDRATLPETLLSSHLVQDNSDSKHWKIITFWRSKEDMDAYRASVETPAWFLVFKAVSVEPILKIFQVIDSKS